MWAGVAKLDAKFWIFVSSDKAIPVVTHERARGSCLQPQFNQKQLWVNDRIEFAILDRRQPPRYMVETEATDVEAVEIKKNPQHWPSGVPLGQIQLDGGQQI